MARKYVTSATCTMRVSLPSPDFLEFMKRYELETKYNPNSGLEELDLTFKQFTDLVDTARKNIGSTIPTVKFPNLKDLYIRVADVPATIVIDGT